MVAKYFYEAEPHWPEDPRTPDGAPDVIVVLLDDVGFAQLGCYGSDIATPHIDALAAEGLQYTNFHTTALCSASRASLLTGRNHHRNGMGRVIELATGFPGYTHPRAPAASPARRSWPRATRRWQSASGTSHRKRNATPGHPGGAGR